MRSGNLNISGGTIESTGTFTQYTSLGDGNTVDGAAIAIVQHTTKNNINVSIDGGNFKGEYAFYERNFNNTDNINVEINNGYFEGKIYSDTSTDIINGGTYTDPRSIHYLNENASIQINLLEDYEGEEEYLNTSNIPQQENKNKKPFEIDASHTINMNLGGHTFSMTEEGNTSAGNVSITNGLLKVEEVLTVTGGILIFSVNGKMSIASDA